MGLTFKIINHIKAIIQKIRIRSSKIRLKRTLKESEEIRESDIESIYNTWEELNKARIYNYDEFYNVSLYSSIVNRDISILWNNLILSERKSEKNLYGRLLSMTIIEYLDDINGLLGKNLRKELEQNNMGEYINLLNGINKSFSKIKTQFNSELREIRNNSAAHKTKDSKVLLNFTQKDQFQSLDKITTIVSKINLTLIQLFSQIIFKITEQIKSRK